MSKRSRPGAACAGHGRRFRACLCLGLWLGTFSGQIAHGVVAVFFTVYVYNRVKAEFMASHATFHVVYVFGAHIQLAGHLVDLVWREGLTIFFEAVQVKKQLAVRLGGDHFHHAPVANNVFVNFCLDPVQRKADQAHATRGVKAFHCLHQADIALLNEIGMGQAIAKVLACHGYHQAQVAKHQAAGGFKVIVALQAFAELNFFLGGQHGNLVCG